MREDRYINVLGRHPFAIEAGGPGSLGRSLHPVEARCPAAPAARRGTPSRAWHWLNDLAEPEWHPPERDPGIPGDPDPRPGRQRHAAPLQPGGCRSWST